MKTITSRTLPEMPHLEAAIMANVPCPLCWAQPGGRCTYGYGVVSGILQWIDPGEDLGGMHTERIENAVSQLASTRGEKP